jgi:hypothetical protein
MGTVILFRQESVGVMSEPYLRNRWLSPLFADPLNGYPYR